MKRRTFLTTAAGVAASTAFPQFAIGKPGKSANSKLNVAFIGSGGWIAQQPYNRVAPRKTSSRSAMWTTISARKT